MPDITMCMGNCPISEYCYRYTAKPNPRWQSYSLFGNVCLSNEESKYSEFIPDERKTKEDEKALSFNDILLAEFHKLMDKAN